MASSSYLDHSRDAHKSIVQVLASLANIRFEIRCLTTSLYSRSTFILTGNSSEAKDMRFRRMPCVSISQLMIPSCFQLDVIILRELPVLGASHLVSRIQKHSWLPQFSLEVKSQSVTGRKRWQNDHNRSHRNLRR